MDPGLRTIMEKIDEFFCAPTIVAFCYWTKPKQELYFELAVGKASRL